MAGTADSWRPLPEQRVLAEEAPQRRARRGLDADGEQRAAIGRVRLAHGDVRYTGRGQRPFQDSQTVAGSAQHHGVRAGRQGGREPRALAGGVDYLGGEGSPREVVANDDVVVEECGPVVSVNASWDRS